MIKNIQMLRALAAVMVFAYHAAPQYKALGGTSAWFTALSSLGFAGVDVFFVISGFVAALTTQAKPRTLQNAWAFLHRRLLRIYLGYWPLLALTLIMLLLFKPSALAGLDLLGSLFLTTIQLNRLVIYVSWSLSFELLFYLLVAASFVLPGRMVKPVLLAASAGLLLLLVTTLHQVHSSTQLFLSMLLEFLAGALVYGVRAHLTRRAYLLPCAMVVAGCFVMGYWLNATDGSIRVLIFGTAAVALLVLALVLEQSGLYVAHRMGVALGNASYTVYLCHLAFVAAFHVTGLREALAGQPVLLREAGFFLYFALCLWASHQLYLRLERPLYLWATSLKHGSSRPVPQSSHGA